MEKFVETRGGWGKLACWNTKAAISLKRVKIEEKLLSMGAYRNSPKRFLTVPSPTPYGLLFPRSGFAPPKKTPIENVGKRVHMYMNSLHGRPVRFCWE